MALQRIGETMFKNSIENAFLNIKDFGAVGNGVTDDYAAFNSMKTQVGVNNVTVLLPAGTYIISDTITFPNNIKFYFMQGAKLSVAVNKFIHIYGYVDAGCYQHIFTGSGACYFFGNDVIYLPWFGAKGDGIDCTAEFKNAVKCVNTISVGGFYGSILYIPRGRYVISDVIKLQFSTVLEGESKHNTVIEFTGTNAISNDTNVQQVNGIIKNIRFNNTSNPKTNYAIYLHSVDTGRINQISIQDCYFIGGEAGIYANDNALYLDIERCECYNSTYGIMVDTSSYITVDRSTFRSNTTAIYTTANSKNIKAVNSTFIGNGKGINIQGNNHQILNNYFATSTDEDIYLQATSSIISGNQCCSTLVNNIVEGGLGAYNTVINNVCYKGMTFASNYTITSGNRAPGIGINKVSNGLWDGTPLYLGAYCIWVDGTGKLRIKNGAPANDADGTIIGTQA